MATFRSAWRRRGARPRTGPPARSRRAQHRRPTGASCVAGPFARTGSALTRRGVFALEKAIMPLGACRPDRHSVVFAIARRSRRRSRMQSSHWRGCRDRVRGQALAGAGGSLRVVGRHATARRAMTTERKESSRTSGCVAVGTCYSGGGTALRTAAGCGKRSGLGVGRGIEGEFVCVPV